MPRALKSVTFVYVPREDRILAAINAGHPDAWSCWLTRRLALAVLERTADYLASSSNLAQRAPADFRSEMIAFERDAAIAKTAKRDVGHAAGRAAHRPRAAAELAERLTISQHGERLSAGVARTKRRRRGRAGQAGRNCSACCRCCRPRSPRPAGWPRPAKPQAAPAPPQPIPNRCAIDDLTLSGDAQDGSCA